MLFMETENFLCFSDEQEGSFWFRLKIFTRYPSSKIVLLVWEQPSTTRSGLDIARANLG